MASSQLPVASEVSILREMFVEAASMWGESCNVTLYNNYTDNDITGGTLGAPVEYTTGAFFDEYPTVRTLKSLNLYVEDDEIMPSLLYLPVRMTRAYIGSTPVTEEDLENNPNLEETVQIREGSKLVLNIGDNFSKEFKIQTVRSPYRNSVFYTCKLVPWFNVEPHNEADDTFDASSNDGEYNFFNVEGD